jgi:Ca-activated chloride channel family protein
MKDIIRLDKSGHLLVEGKPAELAQPAICTVILVIDRSGSMAGQKTMFASAGAWDFSQSALNKGFRVATIDFATGAKITCPPSKQPDQIQIGCFADSLTGSTEMHKGLDLAASLGPRLGDTIVVVTDGAVDNPKSTLAIGSSLKSSGVEILAIGTDDADKVFLSKLASRPDLGIKVASTNLRQAITDASKLLGTSRK